MFPMDVLNQIKDIIDQKILEINRKIMKIDSQMRLNRRTSKVFSDCGSTFDFVQMSDDILEKMIPKEDERWQNIRQLRYLLEHFGKDGDQYPQFKEAHVRTFKIFQNLKNKLEDDQLYITQTKVLELEKESFIHLKNLLHEEKNIEDEPTMNALLYCLENIHVDSSAKYAFLIELMDRNLRNYQWEEMEKIDSVKKEDQENIETQETSETLEELVPLEEETIVFRLNEEKKQFLKQIQKLVGDEPLKPNSWLEICYRSNEFLDMDEDTKKKVWMYTMKKSFLKVVEDIQLLTEDFNQDFEVIFENDYQELQRCFEGYKQTILDPNEDQESLNYLNQKKTILFLQSDLYQPYLVEDIERENDPEFYKKIEKILSQLSLSETSMKENDIYSDSFKEKKIHIYREIMPKECIDIAYTNLSDGILILGAVKNKNNLETIENTQKIDSIISKRLQNYDTVIEFYSKILEEGNTEFIYENQRFVQMMFIECENKRRGYHG